VTVPTPAPTPAPADVLSGFGLRARLPRAWEGRLYLRPQPTARFTGPAPGGPSGASPGALGWLGEDNRPVMHLADFPLPATRGDFGSGALEQMPDRRAFVALLEYGPDEVDTALFAPAGMPRPQLREFSPDGLQRRIRGQRGYQRFFTLAGRAFCLYVVLGSAGTAQTVDQVNLVLSGIEVS
jgi:hypothetical protein